MLIFDNFDRKPYTQYTMNKKIAVPYTVENAVDIH